MTGPAPDLCCVILTQGGREEELLRVVHSVQSQQGGVIDVLVVGNGAEPPALPGTRVATLPGNVGIPGGRNEGVARTQAQVVVFLDDDGWWADDTTADRLRRVFAEDPGLGVVSFRIVDPESGATSRRHVPRVRVGDPTRSSRVTTFLGGACAVRRRVFDEVGLQPDCFFYAHEETDLAWRAIDAGWGIRYDGDVVMYHPATSPTRHPSYLRLNARNRVWLVRRRLPVPLAVAHLLTWVALTVLRVREPRALRAWFAGFVEGLRTPCGERRPISWRTAARMTSWGRPPVV